MCCFLRGFFPSMSSHVLTLCQMHSDRTLVHPYWMRVLWQSYILLSSHSYHWNENKRYENAPFDNKHAFLNTLLTFTNLFSVSIFLLEKTSTTLYLEESGMLPVYNITNGSLLTSCTPVWEATSWEQSIQCYWLKNFPLDCNIKGQHRKMFLPAGISEAINALDFAFFQV